MDSRKENQWASEKLVFDGDEFFEFLVASIDRARESVELESYIYAVDPIGEMVSNALVRAVERGLKVRLLVDGVGSAPWIERKSGALSAQGVHVRIFHPIYKVSSIAKWLWQKGFRGSTADERRRFFWRLNRRTHRKMCILDQGTPGASAWVGSLNVACTHCRAHSGRLAWRDTAALVQGQGIADLQIAFDYAWARSRTPAGKRRLRDQWLNRLVINPIERFKNQSSNLVRLNYTLRMRRQTTRELLDRIRSARDRIWLTTPYLAPTATIMRALVEAASRGADVRILVPRKSDVFFMPWVAHAFYQPLLAKNVSIYEYLPRFLHAKSIIIDDWAIIGTSNMNRRSLIHDLEVDIVISHPESKAQLSQQFLDDLKSTEQIKTASPWYNRWIGRILSYLLKDLI